MIKKRLLLLICLALLCSCGQDDNKKAYYSSWPAYAKRLNDCQSVKTPTCVHLRAKWQSLAPLIALAQNDPQQLGLNLLHLQMHIATLQAKAQGNKRLLALNRALYRQRDFYIVFRWFNTPQT